MGKEGKGIVTGAFGGILFILMKYIDIFPFSSKIPCPTVHASLLWSTNQDFKASKVEISNNVNKYWLAMNQL